VSPLHDGDNLTAAGVVQRRLWGTDPPGWALFGEPHSAPLFEVLLDAVGAAPGCRLLDVGCGTGMALQLAGDRGAEVAGLDVTPGLLQIASSRLPQAELWCADMAELPFPDSSFDAVIGVNSFQFAADPKLALTEAARVVRPGGQVAASLFAEPERSESTAVHLAMAALSPPARQADHAPYALSAPGNLEAALVGAGLELARAGEVAVVWRYDTVADAIRGLLSSAGATRAVEDAGEDAVRAAIASAVVPFTTAAGVVELHNTFRWVSARRPD
jgi:SAM-dependent methyltransferase